MPGPRLPARRDTSGARSVGETPSRLCDRRRGQTQGEQVGGNQPTALQDGLLGAKLQLSGLHVGVLYSCREPLIPPKRVTPEGRND
jgi:hypothetical protein